MNNPSSVFTITVPSIEEILSSGVVISTAIRGESWSHSQLADFAKKSGVYVHHSDNQILYVGQSTKGSQYGNFGERLRREFQTTSSSDSPLNKLLCAQVLPIRTCMFPLDVIDQMITSNSNLTMERKALILEQLLIGLHNPVGNKI